ncbi:MAG: transcription termination factor Rho, partial [Acidimicrobiaceae bacterium]
EQQPSETSQPADPSSPADGRGEERHQDRSPGGGQGQQGQPGARGDDGEPANRRRRRRGRDRDRQGASGQGAVERQGGQERAGQDRGPQERSGGQERGQAEPEFLGEPIDVEGYLDLRDEGYGFLRVKGFLPSKDDVYVSVKQVRQFGLRKGDFLKGASRPAARNEKNPALLRIDLVNDVDPEQARTRRRFEDLTPLFPDEKLKMEQLDDPTNMTARIIDLISPIGKGQRGIIVAPPKAGKTTVMKQIARSIEVNHPEVHLIVLLVDERPEEVTDMKRWLLKGEVAASTFDRPSEEHTLVAELTIERAKRMVEAGKDVAIILDGITRLARAYNLAAPASGRIMSGGIDAAALYPPKKFFGAARNIEEGGSLTILATALVENGSRMDEHIFEEFKATGNMELRLDRKLAERRIYPAIDVDASSIRHEELLFAPAQLSMAWKLRRVLSGLAGSEGGGSGGAGLELLIDRMKTFKSNDEFLREVAKAPSISG